MMTHQQSQSAVNDLLASLAGASLERLELSPFVIDVTAEGSSDADSSASWRVPLSAGPVTIQFTRSRARDGRISAFVAGPDASPASVLEVVSHGDGEELAVEIDMHGCSAVSPEALHLRIRVLCEIFAQLGYAATANAALITLSLESADSQTLLADLLRVALYAAHFLGTVGCHIDFLPALAADTIVLVDPANDSQVIDLCETRLANGRRAVGLKQRYEQMRDDGRQCVECRRSHVTRDDDVYLVTGYQVPPSEGVPGVIRTYCSKHARGLKRGC